MPDNATRLRDFIGDYPVNVHGMSFDETKELILVTARYLDIQDIITSDLIDEIYRVSSGHPYVIKVMLGSLSKADDHRSLPKLIAGKREVLTALFERTYSALTPCAQQVFLTLASWNSAVPRLALEAVLMISIDEPLEVEKAIDSLTQYSMIEEVKNPNDGQYYIGLPFVAMTFGKKKANIANKMNRMLSSNTLIIDSDRSKKELVTRLYDVMYSRKNEADANDYSRAAWLALHLGKESEAREMTEKGLKKDQYNKYCLKLNEKFKKS